MISYYLVDLIKYVFILFENKTLFNDSDQDG